MSLDSESSVRDTSWAWYPSKGCELADIQVAVEVAHGFCLRRRQGLARALGATGAAAGCVVGGALPGSAGGASGGPAGGAASAGAGGLAGEGSGVTVAAGGTLGGVVAGAGASFVVAGAGFRAGNRDRRRRCRRREGLHDFHSCHSLISWEAGGRLPAA